MLTSTLPKETTVPARIDRQRRARSGEATSQQRNGVGDVDSTAGCIDATLALLIRAPGGRNKNRMVSDHEEFLTRLGARVRTQREKLRLSQRELADALQVSPQAVSKWERGENGPELSMLPHLSRVLGLSADDVLGIRSDVGSFEASLLVTSLKDFTAKARQLRPEQVQSLRDAQVHVVGDAVVRFGGIIVKYLGEGVLAFFSGPSHGDRATEAASSARAVSPPDFVAGLAAGHVHVSIIGHSSLRTRDLAGSAVNLAFRIHEWAQTRSARIGVDDSVARCMKDASNLLLCKDVDLKGFPSPTSVWEIPLGGR